VGFCQKKDRSASRRRTTAMRRCSTGAAKRHKLRLSLLAETRVHKTQELRIYCLSAEKDLARKNRCRESFHLGDDCNPKKI
jgi:hypothetical protein